MKKKILLLFALAMSIASAYGQEQNVTGTVTDAGAPLPGVTVIVKGTTQGTITDLDGNYSLNTSSDAVLQFSFIGYTSQEIAVGNQSTINIAMEQDSEQLEEVTVMGYAKQDQSSNVTSVEKVTDIVTPNVANSLQGKAAGVSMTAPSGQPGAKPTIRIRGVGSISSSQEPLYVIDGMIIDNTDIVGANQQSERDPMSLLNPEDIEDVKILTDAAATALYGARASNGVIVVTTKSGVEGKTQFNLNVSAGVAELYQGNYEPMRAKDFIEFQKYGDVDINGDPFTTDTDWINEAFRKGAVQNYQLTASGGTEKTKHYVSLGYYNQDGILKGSDFERYSARVNMDNQVNDRLSYSIKTDISYIVQNDASDGALFSSPLMTTYMYPAIIAPYAKSGDLKRSVDGNTYLNPFLTADESGYDNYYYSIGANFLSDLKYNYRRTKSFNAGLQGNVKYEIGKGFAIKSNNAVRIQNTRYDYYTAPISYDGFNGPNAANGSVSNTSAFSSLITSTNLLTYSNSFGDHTVDAIGGVELQKYDASNQYGYGAGVPLTVDNLGSASSGFSNDGYQTQYRFFSFLSQVQYNYLGKYYVSGSYRRDGSSRFGKENQYGNFWSAGGSWILSNEDFLSTSDLITNAKIRGSIGTTGNAGIGNYAAMGLYGYTFYNTSSAAVIEQVENPDLTWEQKLKANIGFDITFIDKVSLSVDFYNEQTSDLLMQVPTAGMTGFANVYQNVGEMRNRGIEFTINSTNIDKNGFLWTTNLNMSFNQNEVTKLYNGQRIEYSRQVIEEGKPLNAFFIQEWAGANPENGKPSWYLNREPTQDELDKNQVFKQHDGRYATSYYSKAEKVDVGDPYPDFSGGFTNNLSYKGFDFSFMFTFSVGNDIFNSGRRYMDQDQSAINGGNYYSQMKIAKDDRWTKKGDIASRPLIDQAGDDGWGNVNSSRYMEDGSYLQLRNITLGYTLPKQTIGNIGLSNLRVYTSFQNLFTVSNYTGYSPTTVDNTGVAFFDYPDGRTYTFGINCSF
ncbi:SusC/RagA family TonB-linked outer membrane protein [Flammeovirga kamogawensis]|uniref:TonB-dependent receptor n=1 Tax=Flammeovirga kamogawensis TaxID=373891 RepID=A0ABX8GR24_9BACT|nr:TonB-dependent receptor [Flammeovirga kamogawensis]MBB6462760.1 TonB-linked SusC/RagA family outer membrane protein [Flammeovirga kamogawensis]QWG06010.1 TonB-dependent receptor [Flammeovirga kamogawensis]TRX67840.1 TonB-dependent receptor [Flammeovirga kamogawensis]